MIGVLEQVHYFSNVALFGLIWTIQLVHYPGFKYVDRQEFTAFTMMHTYKVTFFVAPLMLLEFSAALTLMVMGWFSVLPVLFFIIILMVWASTFLMSVPYHQRLARGKDEAVIDKLIQTNWIRTILWTVKLVLLIIVY